MVRCLIPLSVIVFIFGCSITSNKLQPVLAPAANVGNVVMCQNECKDEWERAQIWIAKHSVWKIQTSTNVLIQTFSPVRSEPSYGFSVTKEPVGSGKYMIQVEMVCGNMLGCDPKPIDVRNAFNYYIKTGVDLLQGQGYLGAIR